MFFPRIGSNACCAVVLVALMTEVVCAQQPGTGTKNITQSFVELQRILKVGQRVVLTDDRGGEIKGKVAELSASSLVVMTPEKRTFAEGAITKIRRTDSSWNGALIGLGVGAACAGAGMRVSYQRGGDAYYGWVLVGSWLLPTVGAITGLVADKHIGNEQIYRAPPRKSRPSVAISPLVGKASLGVSASIKF